MNPRLYWDARETWDRRRCYINFQDFFLANMYRYMKWTHLARQCRPDFEGWYNLGGLWTEETAQQKARELSISVEIFIINYIIQPNSRQTLSLTLLQKFVESSTRTSDPNTANINKRFVWSVQDKLLLLLLNRYFLMASHHERAVNRLADLSAINCQN